jgi:transcriptional regulator with XRE-family HTH domain
MYMAYHHENFVWLFHNLRALRRSRHESLEELARVCCVPYSMLLQLEHDFLPTHFTLLHLTYLAEHYHLSPHALLGPLREFKTS